MYNLDTQLILDNIYHNNIDAFNTFFLLEALKVITAS